MTDYQEKLNQLIYNIKYELAEGIHTYSRCECGRNSTRRGKCAACLLEEFIKDLKNDR